MKKEKNKKNFRLFEEMQEFAKHAEIVAQHDYYYFSICI